LGAAAKSALPWLARCRRYVAGLAGLLGMKPAEKQVAH